MPVEHNEARNRGLAIVAEMFGQRAADKLATPRDAAEHRLAEFMIEWVYDKIWGDEQLTRRERSLITVALLAASNREFELIIHAKAALNNGCTVAELQEVMTHVIAYCGFPAGLSGHRVLRKI